MILAAAFGGCLSGYAQDPPSVTTVTLDFMDLSASSEGYRTVRPDERPDVLVVFDDGDEVEGGYALGNAGLTVGSPRCSGAAAPGQGRARTPLRGHTCNQ